MTTFAMSHQHWVKGGGFTVSCELRLQGEGAYTVAYAYGKSKQGQKRLSFKERSKKNGKDDSVFKRGKYQEVLKGLKTSSGSYDTDMLFQFRIKDAKPGELVEVRFVRVYASGKRDGTGDATFVVGG